MEKILLIEDDSSYTVVIKANLESQGYKVVVAETAEEGIRLTYKEKPDLILMDMLLPGITGLEAVRRLKKDSEAKDIPIIAITAIDAEDVEKACREAGVINFIKKPYEFPELLIQIKATLREERNNSLNH